MVVSVKGGRPHALFGELLFAIAEEDFLVIEPDSEEQS